MESRFYQSFPEFKVPLHKRSCVCCLGSLFFLCTWRNLMLYIFRKRTTTNGDKWGALNLSIFCFFFSFSHLFAVQENETMHSLERADLSFLINDELCKQRYMLIRTTVFFQQFLVLENSLIMMFFSIFLPLRNGSFFHFVNAIFKCNICST